MTKSLKKKRLRESYFAKCDKKKSWLSNGATVNLFFFFYQVMFGGNHCQPQEYIKITSKSRIDVSMPQTAKRYKL